LKLIAKPRFASVLLAGFDDPHEACRTVQALFHAGLVPAACEFVERDGWQMAIKHLGRPMPNADRAAQLMIELDGNDEDKLSEELERAGMICEQGGAADVILAESGQRRTELWDVRRAVGEAVKAHSVYKEEDTVVPRAKLPDLFVGVKEICGRRGVRSVCYGHAGDGNLHVNVLKETMTDDEWRSKLPPTIEEIFRLTVELGGTISGEHGIGWSQKAYLPLALGEVEMGLHRKLKRMLDPRGILNPGKVFD
jgi:glycolate oxidase